MTGLKTIYDRFGKPIADIRARVIRSSLLNDYGEAVFQIPVSDPKCTSENLGYGNYLLVQDENLPSWVGVLDTPRIWRKGYVEVHAFEPEYLLKFRYAPVGSRSTGTPGFRVRFLLDAANAMEATIIEAGDIFEGGVSNEETFETDVFSHIKKMSTNNGHDFMITPALTASGMLKAELIWKERVSINTNFFLTQGVNVSAEDQVLEENGALVNYCEAVLDDSGNEEIEQTITRTYWEESSYGLRAQRITLTGEATSSSLETLAQQTVKAKKEPAIAVPLVINNADGNTFNQIALGNTATYKITNAGFLPSGSLGFEKQIRILGYRYDEILNTCQIFPGEVSE